MPDIPVFVLFGATASGKTDVAGALWASPRAPDAPRNAPASPACFPDSPRVEIISADSMQVYRGMDVGTAKPPAELLSRLPHHLIDIRHPSEGFCAGDFVREADACCAAVYARGNIPVICGGTGFYIKNFLYGLPSTPQSNPETRKKLAGRMKSEGALALLEELRRVDPVRAEKLNVRDEYRIVRALEIYYDSGVAQSDFTLPEKTRGGYRFRVVSLDRPREELYRRIEKRCGEMFSSGLEEEVARLVASGCRADFPGMRAIGYREFFQQEGCVEKLAAGGALSPEETAAIRERIVRDSKRYAKRQETFIKPLPGVVHVSARDAVDAANAVGEAFSDFVRAG